MRLSSRDLTASDAVKRQEFRKKVLTRDNNECILCRSQRSLHAHHIVQWAKNEALRFDLDNAVTLCYSCHKQVTNREVQYEYIFKNYILTTKNKKTGFDPYELFLKNRDGDENAEEKSSTEV